MSKLIGHSQENTKKTHPFRTKHHEFKHHPMVIYRQVCGKYISDVGGEIPAHDENIHFIFILSDTGTGKTTYSQNALESILSENPHYVCAALSPRCSVTLQHQKNFKPLGFIHYNEDKKLLPTAKRIITTLDSLFKIDKDIDVLYIDEVESLFEHVFADTLKQLNQVWQKLLQVCSRAKKVICTDAQFNQARTVNSAYSVLS